MINAVLPEDLRDYSRSLDKKSVAALLSEVAKKYPDKYKDISFKLNQLGRKVSNWTGGNSFDIQHVLRTEGSRKRSAQLQAKIDSILDDDALDDKQRREKVVNLLADSQKAERDATFNEAKESNNPLAIQVLGAGRGSPASLTSIISGDLMYEDSLGNRLPVPVTRSYSQGLSPAEYWAATYGARTGGIGTKLAVADAGYFSKLLQQVSHRLVVTDEDADGEPDTLRGFPVDVDDNDNEGALLAAETGGYPRNTVLTPKILRDLRAKGLKRMLVRSVIAGGSPEGGVYARDLGIREFNRMPRRGESAGFVSAQAIGEPVNQGSLGAKHCLSKDTPVRMADGSVKPIYRVKAGDWVLGCGLDRVTLPVKVVRVYKNGTRPCIRTMFAPAFYPNEKFYIESTADHKILGGRQVWGQAEEALNHVPRMLPVGQKSRVFYAYLPLGTQNRAEWYDEPMARLVGLLAGDGCYTESVKGVHLSCHDPSLVDALAESLVPLNLRLHKLAGHGGYYRVSQIEQTTAHRDEGTGRFLNGARNPVRAWLEARGMYGKLAHEKQLPPEIDSWTNESVADYLAGLFSADGSWYNLTGRPDGAVYVGLGLTSYELLTGVKRLLETRFGIYTGAAQTRWNEDRKRPIYSFTVACAGTVRRITNLLIDRLVGKKKHEALAAATFEAAREDEYRLIRRSVEDLGEQETYDLEVDHEDHLFVLANGLIVSNSGGVAGATAAVSGFEALDQLINSPETFKGGATHASLDGMITRIDPAPGGGVNVTVAGEPHYVPAGLNVKFKVGDTVEAGDMLSDGMPVPDKITQYKGIGEARRYFTNNFLGALRGAGIKSDRRNVEVVSRGLINHVRFSDLYKDHIPDDVVPYNLVESTWEPREDSEEVNTHSAKGMFLEKPYLHYTIGTPVRASVMKDLNDFGVSKVMVNKKPPPFTAEFVPAPRNLSYDEDPYTRMLGSGLEKSMLDAVHRGGQSNQMSTSFVPSRIHAVDFGRKGLFNTPKRD